MNEYHVDQFEASRERPHALSDMHSRTGSLCNKPGGPYDETLKNHFARATLSEACTTIQGQIYMHSLANNA